MRIEIANWSNFNPRTDVKNTSWFRLQNTFLTDPEFFEFSAEQKLVWIALLCEASRKQAGVVVVSPALIATLIKTTTEQVVETIEAFNRLGILKYPRNVRGTSTSRPRHAHVPLRNGTERNDTVRNETEQKGVAVPPPAPSSFDLGLAEEWAAFAKGKSDTLKPNVTKYADAIRRLQSSVGLTEAQVRETFEWIKTHDFWQRNALSPEGLFKRKDPSGPRKIDHIRTQMIESGAAGAVDWENPPDWDKLSEAPR